jgi:putative flippase GtrA
MKRVVRYFGVGAMAAAVDILLFAWLAGSLGYPYLAVGCFTFVLATAVNYALSVRFVFRSGVRFARRHEILLVFGISAVGLALNQAILYLAIGRLDFALVPSKLGATGVVFAWNYFARSHFVFRGSP